MRVFIGAHHNNMAYSSAACKEDEKLKESMVKLVQQGLQRSRPWTSLNVISLSILGA